CRPRVVAQPGRVLRPVKAARPVFAGCRRDVRRQLDPARWLVMHLAYGTNVHPAEDLRGIVEQLETYSLPVRRRLDSDVLGLGLWLAAPVAAALAEDAALRGRLRSELDARRLEVVTLNGFPYAAFHAPVVKHAVYRPDWTERERLRYTLQL